MKKTSASTLFNCYIWLVEVINASGEITRGEIDRRWSASVLNEENEGSLPERTFHRWRVAAEELFGVNIACNRSKGTYFIENGGDNMALKGLHSWLFNALSVNSMIMESRDKDVQQSIFFEEIPAGQKYLTIIIKSLRDKRKLEIVHHSFGKEPNTYHVHPYCLKVFKQRWYMLGYVEEKKDIRIFALDRIEDLRQIEEVYIVPSSVDPKKYFENIYGVGLSQKKPERICVKINADQVDYFLSLPLHRSQKLIKRTPEYSVLEFNLVPNFEFKQVLASYLSQVEVLSPKKLRNEFKNEVQKMLNIYSNNRK